MPAASASRPPRRAAWDPAARSGTLVRLATLAGALTIVAWMIGVVVGPFFARLDTFGFHDWDAETSHRELVVQALRQGEFPWWNPYACGGFTAWGYVEADTTIVSPWLPFYLLLPMALALRVETVGMAILGALGAWLFAARFTRSHALRAMVAVLWAVNGRWALQTASGHTWHLAYAWLPFCFATFEAARAGEPPPRLGRLPLPWEVLCAASFAMLLYAGGIYPLPHAILSVGVYALVLSIAHRTLRPLALLAAAGALSVGLAAPKLFPLLAAFQKVPRLIESKEAIDLGALLTMLVSPDQHFGSRPARVPAYGWHEWGIYVGWGGVALLLYGLLAVERAPREGAPRRELALRVTGALLLVLGLGAFHPLAPWTLLHGLPPFSSQHVPSRFLYPAVLVLGALAALGLGRWVDRRLDRRPWLDAALLVPLAMLAADVAEVAKKPMAQAMWMEAPAAIERQPFHFEQEPPVHYRKRDWAGPMYLAMRANVGVINCYGTPPFEPKGARALDRPGYRGEVWIARGREVLPQAGRVTRMTPNAASIELFAPTEPGDVVVFNMNHDEGWSSDAGPVVAHEAAVAVRPPGGATAVSFRYRSPRVGLGLAAFAVAAAVCAAWVRRARADAVEFSGPIG